MVDAEFNTLNRYSEYMANKYILIKFVVYYLQKRHTTLEPWYHLSTLARISTGYWLCLTVLISIKVDPNGWQREALVGLWPYINGKTTLV